MTASKARFLSIKWKAFIPTSLLLSLTFLGFIVSVAYYLQNQFDNNRNELFANHVQQLDSLLELYVLRNQQLVMGVSTNPTVREALRSGDTQRLHTSLTEPFWTLGVEAGAYALAVYSADGDEMAALGERFHAPSLVQDAGLLERPQWAVSCAAGHCELALIMPLLVDGETVLLAMSTSVADLVIQFNRMTGIDLAILTAEQESEGFELPSWQRDIAALTERDRTLPLLLEIGTAHSLSALSSSPLVLETGPITWEVRAARWQGTDLIMAEDVSDEYRQITAAIRSNILYGALALILAELMLLWILWSPMTRLRKTAAYLPMLAENRFDDIRRALAVQQRQGLFDDETDVLSATASKVSRHLEAMQNELQARNQELQGERDFVHQLLNTVPALILMLDHDGSIIMISQYGAGMTGYSQEELEGQSVEMLLPGGSWGATLRNRLNGLLTHRRQSVSYESDVLCKNGAVLHTTWHNTLILDRERQEDLILAVALDITARKEAEEKTAWLASRDALTGLFNRRCFTDELNDVIQKSKKESSTSAVMFFDLDRFKDVNDASGHQVGDLLLKRIAQSLSDTARESDFVARLGGDEFAIIAKGIDMDDLPPLVERYSRALSQVQVTGKTHSHRCTASIGVAMLPIHGETVEDLLANADLAMYRAKEVGRNRWQIYDPREDSSERVHERVYWNDKVDHVLKTGDFEIYFQPIMATLAETTCHYEALLRVFDGEGQLATGQFVQAAERNGSIHLLDEKVVERVMEHQAELLRRNIRVCISINLSGASFQRPERLLLHVEQLQERHQVPADSLIFEITETAAVEDIAITRQHIALLRSQGFKFALDDFGMGFSSLFYLKQLPVDYLKIDGAFIQNLCDEPDDQALVQALVQVAKIYQLQTVAEFVENRETVELLKTYGVDFVQGYHVGKPRPFRDVFFTGQAAPSDRS